MKRVWSRGWSMVKYTVFDSFGKQGATSSPFFRLWLWLIVSVDVGLIILHLLYLTTDTFESHVYSIESELGYGDFYQSIKAGWAGLIFLWIAVDRRIWPYLVWGLFFGYMAIDDFLAVHETLGAAIANAWQLPVVYGLREVDIGELFVHTGVGLLLFPLFLWSYSAGDRQFRRDSKILAGLIIILAFFGAIVDTLHSFFGDTSLEKPVGMIEDAGELFVLSLMLWVASLILAHFCFAPNKTT